MADNWDLQVAAVFGKREVYRISIYLMLEVFKNIPALSDKIRRRNYEW